MDLLSEPPIQSPGKFSALNGRQTDGTDASSIQRVPHSRLIFRCPQLEVTKTSEWQSIVDRATDDVQNVPSAPKSGEIRSPRSIVSSKERSYCGEINGAGEGLKVSAEACGAHINFESADVRVEWGSLEGRFHFLNLIGG